MKWNPADSGSENPRHAKRVARELRRSPGTAGVMMRNNLLPLGMMAYLLSSADVSMRNESRPPFDPEETGRYLKCLVKCLSEKHVVVDFANDLSKTTGRAEMKGYMAHLLEIADAEILDVYDANALADLVDRASIDSDMARAVTNLTELDIAAQASEMVPFDEGVVAYVHDVIRGAYVDAVESSIVRERNGSPFKRLA